MSILYLMIPIAILLSFSFMVAFIWSTKNGQFDDLETPAHRALFEEKKGK